MRFFRSPILRKRRSFNSKGNFFFVTIPFEWFGRFFIARGHDSMRFFSNSNGITICFVSEVVHRRTFACVHRFTWRNLHKLTRKTDDSMEKTLNVHFSLFVGERNAVKILPSEKRENRKENGRMRIKRKEQDNTRRIEENNGRVGKVRKTGRWGETN